MRLSVFLLAPLAFSQPLTHGPSAGDVTSTSAILWARASGECEMKATVGRQVQTKRAEARGDFTAKFRFEGLQPDRTYRYSVSTGAGTAAAGVFRTAPREDRASGVRFAWGGDVAGQNVCRDRVEGIPIVRAIERLPLQFFVGLGDMIYADNTCEAKGFYGNAQVEGGFGPAVDLDGYWSHWKYTFGDAGLRRMLARIPYVAIWDDHEVVNDFGPEHDTRSAAPYEAGKRLMPIGLSAFLDYNPVELPGAPRRLYRSMRWGKHIELIVLDTRQYRDPNSKPDGASKTLLGKEQMAWLSETIRRSDATWKIVVSSVPISIPTGSQPGQGRDGWANFDSESGAETELREIFTTLEASGAYNNVWITTDVHFAAAFEYTPLPAKPEFRVHEVITGPMNAGLFPSDRFDRTFGTRRLFFYGPARGAKLGWSEARRWMNFGEAEVDRTGKLRLSIRDVDGKEQWRLRLLPRSKL